MVVEMALTAQLMISHKGGGEVKVELRDIGRWTLLREARNAMVWRKWMSELRLMGIVDIGSSWLVIFTTGEPPKLP